MYKRRCSMALQAVSLLSAIAGVWTVQIPAQLEAPCVLVHLRPHWLFFATRKQTTSRVHQLLGSSCCAAVRAAAGLVYRDKEASKVVRDMYKLSSSYAASGGAPVDLSDATISKLSSKLQAMKDLKVGPRVLVMWVWM
jgi:hypothetical protein